MQAPTSLGSIFPPEILATILPLAFGCHFGDFTEYTDNRRNICLVCHLWCDVVYAAPAAWRYIPISLYISTEYVRFCIEKAKSSSISVYFKLVRLISLEDTETIQVRTPAELADAVFPLFMDARLDEIFIKSTDRPSCATLTSWLSKINSGGIRRASLIMDAPQDRLGESLSPAPFNGANMLSELHFGHSIPPWPLESLYENVATLRLSHLPMGNPAAWMEISRVLSATSNLTFLQLFRVGCQQFSTTSHPTPVLRNLTNLSITLDHTLGVELVSHIEMPALTGIRLDIDHERFSAKPTVEVFVRSCHHLLRGLRVFDVGSLHATLDEIELLFTCLENLQYLDTSRGSEALTEDVAHLILQNVLKFHKLRVWKLAAQLGYKKLAVVTLLPEGAALVLPNPSAGTGCPYGWNDVVSFPNVDPRS